MTPLEIIKEEADRASVTVKNIRGRFNRAWLGMVRTKIVYRLKDELNMPAAEIGRFLNRDHSSILNVLKRRTENDKQAG